MRQPAPMDRLEGTIESLSTFQELDADYTMKLPALVHLCLDPLVAELEREFDFFGMGRRGIAPITYYLELGSTGIPLALGRPLTLAYTVELFRAQTPPAGASGEVRERLLLDQHIAVHGFRRSGGSRELGFDDGSGEPVAGGDFRLIQIFTRPMAPPGERQVSEVPPEFAGLRERPFGRPLMVPEDLWRLPEGFEALPLPEAPPVERVWSRGNTDINHHVTVTDYLRALELHYALLLHRAGQPVRGHHLRRLRCIFKRPSFAGDVSTLEGKLYRRGEATRLHGGVYKRQPGGALEETPSVTGCLEGVTEEG